MGKYETLLQQYNIAISHSKVLKDQLDEKEKSWKKREEALKTTEKLTRNLCEDILKKDQNEMVLGKDYSWNSVPIDELLRKAQAQFETYIERNKTQLQQLFDLMEEKTVEIDNLNKQIVALVTHPSDISLTEEEAKKIAAQAVEEDSGSGEQSDEEKGSEKNEEEQSEEESAESAKWSKPGKKSGKNGVDVESARFDAGDGGLNEAEGDLIRNAARDNNRITPHSRTNHGNMDNRRRAKDKQKIKKDQDVMSMRNLSDLVSRFGELEWKTLEVVGGKGLSKVSDVSADLIREDSTLTSSKVRMSMNSLVDKGMLNREEVKTCKSPFYVYYLTSDGAMVYKDHFKKASVISDAQRISQEHDNVNHGYSIVMIADSIRELGIFKSVKEFNRKHPIEISHGKKYIPDIICVDKNNATMYIEVEMVTSTPEAFYDKCRKMAAVSDTLNFVVNNRDLAEMLETKIKRWVDSTPKNALQNITIRVTNAGQISGDIRRDENWNWVFKPGRQKEPVENVSKSSSNRKGKKK